ncbi:MAG: hypothetical protein IKN53_07465, partial [Oscillibacter sp.]|nr:hypothetical protein [Oscillibacter sp.]
MQGPKFQVSGQEICLSEAWHPVSGTRNEYRAQFTFSPEWDGYVKTAVFRFGDNSCAEKLITDGECVVPVMPEGWLRVGVYGVTEDRRLPTVYLFESIYVERGAEEGIREEVPQSKWEEFVAAVQTSAQSAAREAAAAVFGDLAGASAGDLLRVAAVDGAGKP